jgi:hypothetical protein
MARGWPGARACDRLDESLVRLKGIAAAVGCISVAVEVQADACPHLDEALHALATLALDEVKAADEAADELRRGMRAANGIPKPGEVAAG